LEHKGALGDRLGSNTAKLLPHARLRLPTDRGSITGCRLVRSWVAAPDTQVGGDDGGSVGLLADPHAGHGACFEHVDDCPCRGVAGDGADDNQFRVAPEQVGHRTSVGAGEQHNVDLPGLRVSRCPPHLPDGRQLLWQGSQGRRRTDDEQLDGRPCLPVVDLDWPGGSGAASRWCLLVGHRAARGAAPVDVGLEQLVSYPMVEASARVTVTVCTAPPRR